MHLSGLIVSAPNQTPNLKRLQLIRILDLPSDHEELPRLVHTIAPNLTHFKIALRLPIARILGVVVNDLSDYLYTSARRHKVIEGAAPAAPGHAFPSSVRRIVVRFDNPSDEAMDALNLMRRTAYFLMNELVVTSSETVMAGEEAPLVVLPSAEEGAEVDEGQFVKELVRDWRSVNIGRDAVWT